MNKDILSYLKNTRSSFKVTRDEIIESFSSLLLEKYNVEIVIIWSTDAKIEVVTFEDKNFIIWDTHFWNYFSLYYQYRRILYNKWEEGKDFDLLLIQTDCIWADLFRISIQRLKNIDSKYAFLLSKYYLQYGKINFGHLEPSEEDSGILYFSKIFILLHELAHTYIDNSNKFKDSLGPIVLRSLTDNKQLLKNRLKNLDFNHSRIDKIFNEIKNLDNEIIIEFFTDIFALMGLVNLQQIDQSKEIIQKNVRNAYVFLCSFRYYSNIIFLNLLTNCPNPSKNSNYQKYVLGKLESLEIKTLIEKDFDFHVFAINDSTLYDSLSRKKYYNRLIMHQKEPGDILNTRIKYHLYNSIDFVVNNYDSKKLDSFGNYKCIIEFNLSYEEDIDEFDGRALYFKDDYE